MRLPRRLVVLTVAAILTGLVALVSLSYGAEYEQCSTYVTATLAATVCTYPGVELKLDARKMQTTLALIADGFQVKDFTRALIVAPGGDYLGTGYYGFYNPASKTIWITNEGMQEGEHIYYTIGHEIAHYLLDLRGVSIYRHHCIIFNGPEMKPLEQMVEIWLGEHLGIDPFRRMAACMPSE